MRARSLLLTIALFAVSPRARAGEDLSFGYIPSPAPGEKPALLVTPARTLANIYVEISAGGKTFTFEKANLPAGKEQRFPWDRDTTVTSATALLRAEFSDGHVEQYEIPIDYSYSEKLSVDLSHARADVSARTLTVSVSTPVQSADIIAYGAHRAVLDQGTVPLSGGPGEIEVPWVGDPGDVVLLDVTVHGGNAWTGFTYSPWFLNIPHEDVLFETDKADIGTAETWKLEATLKQLEDVLDKYGEIVPVKLYIAGCTDTVGSADHNRDLSQARARAIAAWLRSHGYSKPIFYHGFGESLLAVPTPDGVDEAANRRVLYMVGANPPPAGSGVPSVSWSAL